MNLYLQGLKTSWKIFKFNRHFLFFGFVVLFFMIWSMVTTFFLLIDHILYPKFRRIKIQNPVFIIGHPRSGTTLIHHLFTQTDEMAAFKAWHILFPSITQRKLLRPLIRHLVRKNKTEIIPESAGHRIAIDKVEEEEMLFIHNRDTQFVIVETILGFADEDYREIRFHDFQPRSRRIRSAKFLKSCFQRHIYYTGKTQIFAQTHFSTHRIRTLMEVFPDARFIYMHRSPHETLPSYFSLTYNTQDILWGMHRFTKDQLSKFFEYRYQASRELYLYFHKLWHNGEINKSRVLIIPYERLRGELMAVFDEIVSFTGINASPSLRLAVARQAERQRRYQRKHEITPLSRFGIDETHIRDDFAFFFEKNLLTGQPAPRFSLLEELNNPCENKTQASAGNQSPHKGEFENLRLAGIPVVDANADIF
jgi:omega-hydroxy-beta-dihydromenaquinone-9 sulfotransferase